MNKYGKTNSNLDPIKSRLESANAQWTDEGWIVEGDLDLSDLKLTELPLIKSVGGSFYCYNNQLTSLQDAPQSVGGDFYCNFNQLTSLKGAPKNVGGYFNCSCNKLTSLQGAPQDVGGSFYCSYNQLTSLEGTPQSVGGNFYCGGNQLTSLEGKQELIKPKITYSCTLEFPNGEIIIIPGPEGNDWNTETTQYDWPHIYYNHIQHNRRIEHINGYLIWSEYLYRIKAENPRIVSSTKWTQDLDYTPPKREETFEERAIRRYPSRLRYKNE